MRLIDADALQNLLLPIAIGLAKEYGSLGGAVSGVMQHVDNAPTIDAVPVVRCGECIKYNNYKRPNVGYGYCEELCTVMGDEDFCSLGTRREEAEANG